MRRFDWASRMFAVIAEHEGRKFQWGVDDCCLFVSRVVDAMTDGDFTAQLQERYSDQASAEAFIAEYGSLSAAVSHYLGEPSTDRAARGDVVMIEGGMGDALGICMGSYVYSMGDGLQKTPRAGILAVWKV